MSVSIYQAPIPPLTDPAPAAPQDRVRGATPSVPQATPRVTPTATAHRPVIVPPRKSVPLAALLSLFLGPIGVAYSSVLGAAVTALAVLVVGLPIALFFPPWMVVAAILVLPVCVVWGTCAAITHNLGRQALLFAARGPARL